MDNDAQTMYEALGEDFFRRLVHGFYEQVRGDDLIGPMYPEDDLAGAEDRLRWFLVQYWGGPQTFSERRGAPMLRRRHFPYSIGREEAERWLKLMETSLDQFTSEELLPAQRDALWNHMQRVAYMMINKPEEHPGMASPGRNLMP
ncbi:MULTISPECIES: globin [unclassified Corynebacterium]|uniref:globin n=1 Tax=unclassified Corynebacterium TaxID=2624378 RepID=UPI0021A9D3F2|nr:MULTISPECIES: globin [unclassified Corynebacterium]MCT1452728.1 globin [Corynebacterium sp. p3-SID1145]MCT1461630.1 globin [Corynebacterium sp. p3-SID1140]MDN8595583.1 globin [Corynebacterium sp. P4_F2]WKK55530.1 globin [Corynebacterium sp. P4-C1]WKK62940.1 globin [Corynebacterium sp. P8-C1]